MRAEKISRREIPNQNILEFYSDSKLQGISSEETKQLQVLLVLLKMPKLSRTSPFLPLTKSSSHWNFPPQVIGDAVVGLKKATARVE